MPERVERLGEMFLIETVAGPGPRVGASTTSRSAGGRMSDMMQIVVVDDHPLFRDGVVHTLSAEPDIEVVGQGGSAAEAVELAQDRLPDLILLDIHMPGGGLQAAQTI